jgi:hypothetical protein
MIDRLNADDFSAHIGKTFHIVGYDFALTLVALDRREPLGWEAFVRKPFSLILSGPTDRILPEGHYQLEIDRGPSLRLYVIPIFTASRDHQDYQIVFN